MRITVPISNNRQIHFFPESKMTETAKSEYAAVLGIDPGGVRASSKTGIALLSLDHNGTIDLIEQARALEKEELRSYLRSDTRLSDDALRLVSLAAPLTPLPLSKKPSRARAVEIRLRRGSFSGPFRGPSMRWLSDAKSWPRYLEGGTLLSILKERGFPLLTLHEGNSDGLSLTGRVTAEVFPKASLAVWTSPARLQDRPLSVKFHGQLDDWLFPQLFPEPDGSVIPFNSLLSEYASGCFPLKITQRVQAEALRISRIRRPESRREPLRAFVGALQGVLALAGAGCLVGAPGPGEGAVLLPAKWHPSWEDEWLDDRRSLSGVVRVLIQPSSLSQKLLFTEAIEAEPELVL
jgi:hypothetical protein